MIRFVHCWRCRLPSSPSGRRVLVDHMEARGESVSRICADVSHWRRAEEMWRIAPVDDATAALRGHAARTADLRARALTQEGT